MTRERRSFPRHSRNNAETGTMRGVKFVRTYDLSNRPQYLCRELGVASECLGFYDQNCKRPWVAVAPDGYLVNAISWRTETQRFASWRSAATAALNWINATKPANLEPK